MCQHDESAPGPRCYRCDAEFCDCPRTAFVLARESFRFFGDVQPVCAPQRTVNHVLALSVTAPYGIGRYSVRFADDPGDGKLAVWRLHEWQ